MLDWIVEGLRLLLWGLTSACLKLMDICYDLIKDIALADFLLDDQVWQWYYTFMLFLGVLIVARTLSVFLKFSFDEEFREKVNGTFFINKFITISLVIALLPTCLGFISQVSAWGIRNMSVFIGTESADKPSTMMITAFMNTDNGEFDEDGKWIAGEKVTYTLEDIDINEDGADDDDFKFFNAISDLFIMTFVGITASIMLIINGVQIGKRMYSLVMKFCIAPIPISSLIVPGDETFSMWRKMMVSDYLLNFVQTIMIMIIMILSGSKIIQNLGVWVQIILFISGLLALLSGVPELAKIVGGDTSQGNVLQQLASFRMATRGIGHGTVSLVGGALGAAAGGIKNIGSMATYGAGRFLGGKSINDLNNDGGLGPKGGGGGSDNGFMGGGEFKGEKASRSNIDPQAFHQPSTEKQRKAGEKKNIPGMDKMSKGDASLALEKAGFDQSYWHGEGINDTFMPGSNGNDYAAGSDSLSSGMTSSSEPPTGKPSFSYEGSTAQRMSASAYEMNGLKGGAARIVSMGSSHLYQQSARRLSQSKVYRTGKDAKKIFNEIKGGQQHDIPKSPEL